MRFFCLLLLFGLAACVFRTPPTYPVELVQADTLLNHDPEAAMAQLAHYRTQGLDDPSVAYHRLLYTIAGDKLDSVFHSDSLIEWASQQLAHDPLQFARARFYSGLVRYRCNQEDTLGYQRMAEAHSHCRAHGIQEPFLRGMVAFYLGECHFNHTNYDQALAYQQEALRYSSLRNDSLASLADQMGLCKIYIAMKRFNEAEAILDSIPSVDKLPIVFQSHIYSLWGFLYEQQGKDERAIFYNKKMLDPRFVHNRNDFAVFYSISCKYQNLNMPDSALYYGEQALSAIRDSSMLNYAIYHQTAQMAARQQQYRKAARYFEEALRLSLRYTDERSKQSLVEIEKRYDVLRLKQEATEQAARLYRVIELLLLVPLAITGLFLWQSMKRQAQLDQLNCKLQKNKIASSALQLVLDNNSSLDDKIEVLFSKQHLDATELKCEVQKLKKKMRKEALDSLYCLLVENQFLPAAIEGSTATLTVEERVLHYFVQQDWNNQQLAQLLQTSTKVIKVKKYQIKQKLDGDTHLDSEKTSFGFNCLGKRW